MQTMGEQDVLEGRGVVRQQQQRQEMQVRAKSSCVCCKRYGWELYSVQGCRVRMGPMSCLVTGITNKQNTICEVDPCCPLWAACSGLCVCKRISTRLLTSSW